MAEVTKDADRAALEHVVATYCESGGDVALTAKRLGWSIEQVREVKDAIALHLADQVESPEGQRLWRGRILLDAAALTQFAMEKMRTSERAGHRWGGLAVQGIDRQDRLGALALSPQNAGAPAVIVINGDVPRPMPIEATGDGRFRRVIEADTGDNGQK